jgi:hypothetical protein
MDGVQTPPEQALDPGPPVGGDPRQTHFKLYTMKELGQQVFAEIRLDGRKSYGREDVRTCGKG